MDLDPDGRRVVMRKRHTQIRLTAVAMFALGSSGFFFWNLISRPPQQPIVFSHKQHVEKQITCMFCHQYAGQSAIAGIPSVQLCMTCHQSIKADSPEVQKVKAYLEKGQEIPWARVYGFSSHLHVYFNHQRHIAAEVDCAVCHGDVGQMTVAERVVEHKMGWCTDCHEKNKSKFAIPKLANDCLTCHY